MLRLLTLAAMAGLVAATGLAADVTFPLTGENSTVTFRGTKSGGGHDGGFKVLSGAANINGTDATTLKITVDIDVESIFTDTPEVTAHLKSPDFFDVKNHPKAKFVTTKVAKKGNDYTVSGDLTMHGKTKEVSFPAKIAASGDHLELSGETKIVRQDWGINYGKGKVDDEVSLKVKVDAKTDAKK